MTDMQLSTPIQSRTVRQRITAMARTTLNPPLLRRIDQQMMMSRPWVWSLRVHRAVYLGVILLIFAGLLSLLTPINQPASLSRFITTGIVVLVVLQAGAILLWLYGQDRFNVVHEYGITYDRKGWREYVGYAVGFFAILVSLPLFLTMTRQQVQRVDQKQLAIDMLLIRATEYSIQRSSEELESPANYRDFLIDHLATDDVETDWGRFYTFGDHDYVRPSYYDDTPNQDEQFIAAWVTSTDLAPYRTALLNGENPILPIAAKYSGFNLADVIASEPSISDRYFYQNYRESLLYYLNRASQNSRTFFYYGFSSTNDSVQPALLIIFAVALHFALLRILVKYNDKRTLAMLAGWVGLLGGFFWFSFMMSHTVERAFYNSWELFNQNFFTQRYFTALVVLFSVILLVTWLYTRNAPRLERFSRLRAIQLGSLPMLFAALPYALILLISINTWDYAYGSYFVAHFLTDLTTSRGPELSWSLYPLGYWLLYAGQFAYLPLIPYMKKRLVRLQSLPEG